VGAVGDRTVRLAGELADGTILTADTPPERVSEVRGTVGPTHHLTVYVATAAGDPALAAGAVRRWADAGADAVVLQPAEDDPDPEGFVRFVATEVRPLIRTAQSPAT
jgi:alkanesulfonate monooxygenase SsuD/methylene tetrahydromethanopterin reductase-like flavin-dependent oxidoreductase (luciferase family)